MTVLKPRSRTICVRLSEDEYLAFRELCTLSGARSVSDLTRDALHALLDRERVGQSIVTHRDELQSEVKSLNQKLEQLAADFSALRAGSHDSSPTRVRPLEIDVPTQD
jgi:Arc/MetJ-type ribon-helix-helix transcriptional regulator